MGLTRIMFAILPLKTHPRIPLTKDKQPDAASGNSCCTYKNNQPTFSETKTEPTAAEPTKTILLMAVAAKQISGIGQYKQKQSTNIFRNSCWTYLYHPAYRRSNTKQNLQLNILNS
jgi:hypothetical protein